MLLRNVEVTGLLSSDTILHGNRSEQTRAGQREGSGLGAQFAKCWEALLQREPEAGLPARMAVRLWSQNSQMKAIPGKGTASTKALGWVQV